MGQPPRSLLTSGTPTVERGRGCERKTQAYCSLAHPKMHTPPRHAHACSRQHMFTSKVGRQAPASQCIPYSYVKTMVFTCIIAPALTFMSGAPLRPHLVCEKCCHFTLGETEAQKVTEGAMLQEKLHLDRGCWSVCPCMCSHQTELQTTPSPRLPVLSTAQPQGQGGCGAVSP